MGLGWTSGFRTERGLEEQAHKQCRAERMRGWGNGGWGLLEQSRQKGPKASLLEGAMDQMCEHHLGPPWNAEL